MFDDSSASSQMKPYFSREEAERFKTWEPTPSMKLILKRMWAELEVPESKRYIPKTRQEAFQMIMSLSRKCAQLRKDRWDQIIREVTPSDEDIKEIHRLYDELNVPDNQRTVPESKEEALALANRMRYEIEERRKSGGTGYVLGDG